jgi:hypothetical protein
VKEELQKNKGDLPEDLSCWLQQQSTAVQIECMEGLDKAERLQRRTSAGATRHRIPTTTPIPAHRGRWMECHHKKQEEEQQ